LGTSHIELMPVLEHNMETVWGYETTDFTKISANLGGEKGLRDLVNESHDLGMEVIVDMCFNHCGDTDGFEEKDWFIMESGRHTNYSGCGNTFDSHNEGFKEHCKESLDFLLDIGVDGFRFDLSPLMMMNQQGDLIYDGSLLEIIDKEYSDFTRIYEPWSLNHYLKSKFSLTGFEWNDKIRDVIRKYILFGDEWVEDLVREMNAYDRNINYVSCHDGFTLWDSVSFQFKDNCVNGERNRDGNGNEISRCTPFENREEICKKAIQLCILSKGIPMLRGGDEKLNSLQGNNNNYKGLAKSSFHGDISKEIHRANITKQLIDYSKPITYTDTHFVFQGYDQQILIDR
ncbi:MAG: alpha-amylase family glycosyl hydrolase, partial [Cetobacterium sp.]